MKPNLHPSLMFARALLPRGPDIPCLDIVICILTWLKVCSDNWHANATEHEGRPAPEFAKGGALIMTANCTYDAILKAKGAATAKTILKVIDELVTLNPTLKGVLQLLHFMVLQQLYEEAKAHPDTLHKLVTAINEVNFQNRAHSLPCGAEFEAVISAVCQESNAHAQAFAPLLAKLVAPHPNEVVFDPACGPGFLLRACANELAGELATASATKQPQATLHGIANDVLQWSLAKMLLSLAGLPHDHIQHANPLLKPFESLTAAEKARDLGGADIVVMAVPEIRWPWCHGLASQQQDPRLQGRAPFDSRLLLVWQSLTALKPESSRMALIMPIHVLGVSDGEALCQYLVENNLLDAVICLAGHTGHVLLMIRAQRSQTKIAFIQTQDSGALGTAHALQAYQRYQSGQTDPCLSCFDKSTVAANHYQLTLPMVRPVGSACYAPCMTWTFSPWIFSELPPIN